MTRSSVASTKQDHRARHARNVTDARVASILLLLLIAASAALPAQAQSPRQDPSLSLYLDNPMRTFNGSAAIVVDGVLNLKLAAADPSAPDGIRVTYRVEGVVGGATARVDPPEAALHPSATGDAQGSFLVIVEPTGQGSLRGGMLTVVAQTQSTLLTSQAEAEAELAIRGSPSNRTGQQASHPSGNPSPQTTPPGGSPPTSASTATAAEAPRGVMSPPDLRLQSNHEDEPGGGTFLFVLMTGALGAYFGHRLHRRFS